MLIYAGPGPLPLDPAIPDNRELLLHFEGDGAIAPDHLILFIKPLLEAFPAGRIHEEYWMTQWFTDGGGYAIVYFSEAGSSDIRPHHMRPGDDIRNQDIKLTIAAIRNHIAKYPASKSPPS